MEFAGAIVSGCSTKIGSPQALFLIGATAGEGKSQVLEALMSLVPADAARAIAPRELRQENRRIRLQGAMLNTCAEISASAIPADEFKKAITGDWISGKALYKNPVEFHPTAAHVYSSNGMPRFDGGIDSGTARRLACLLFERSVPQEQRTPGIGRRIAEEESDALLLFAIRGALRILRRQAFTMPASSGHLHTRIASTDVVRAFVDDAVVVTKDHKISRTDVYECFRLWAQDAGYAPREIPNRQAFGERAAPILKGVGIKSISSNKSQITGKHTRGYVGMEVVGFDAYRLRVQDRVLAECDRAEFNQLAVRDGGQKAEFGPS